MEYLTEKQLNSKERVNAIQSQKASALFKHKEAVDAYAVPTDWTQPNMVVIHIDDSPLHISSAGDVIGFPCFLRTCPEHARAGVLDSLLCKSQEELDKHFTTLSQSMKERDPNGCLILMPFIEAESSAVMALSHPILDDMGNPLHTEIKDEDGDVVKTIPKVFGGYTIMGVGHDGVTAGHGFNLGFPHSIEQKRMKQDSAILDFLNFSPVTHECEFVFKTSKHDRNTRYILDSVKNTLSYFTQIRNAPEHTPVHPPPEGVDTIGMIPQGVVVVEEVFRATGLEEVAWLEENITKDNCPDGFVVQELGGSRLSHIYAHCRGVGVPYIIGQVNEGERWVEAAMGWVVIDPDSSWEPKPYSPTVYASDFKRGVIDGNKYWAKQQGWFSTFFHQWVSLPMSKPQDVAYLAGMFSSWLAKSILALGLGEMRHAKNLKKNANAPLFATITACVGSDVWKEINNTPYLDSNRGHYYAAIGHLKLDWNDAANLCDFLNRNYRTGWSSSYGGPKWGDSMLVGADLCREIASYLENPDAVDEDNNTTAIEKLMLAVNKAENCVHNNGFLFNKWLSKRAFDAGTEGFSPRKDIDQMASVFAMARQFLDDEYVVPTELVEADEPENDWGKILKFVGKRTPSYWRNNPIALNNNAPESLKDVMEILPIGWRHGDNGSHNNPLNKDFIMCGVTSCQLCESHIKWATANPKKASLPVLAEIKQLFDANSASIMIAPAELDVWLVGKVEETRASIKAQVELMKLKQFNPSAEEFKAIFNSLNPNDLDTPAMMIVLNKWLAKKGDNLPEFLEELTGKKVGDTTAFVKKMEDIDGGEEE